MGIIHPRVAFDDGAGVDHQGDGQGPPITNPPWRFSTLLSTPEEPHADYSKAQQEAVRVFGNRTLLASAQGETDYRVQTPTGDRAIPAVPDEEDAA